MSNKLVSWMPQFNHHFLEMMHNKDFLFLWLAQAFSAFCSQMVNFVLIYIVYQHTNSSFYVSLLYFFYLLPVFLLGLFAGILVDHMSRRRIMIFTNLIQSLIILLYLGVGNTWFLIYPIVFLYSIVDEFYLPAESAMLPTLVQKEHLPIANFLFTIASYGTMVVGITFSGQFIKLLGLRDTFIIASLLLVLATIASFFIKKDIVSKKLSQFKEKPFHQMFQEIKSNYKFILNHRIIYMAMGILLFFELSVATIGIAAPVLGTQILGYNFLDLGIRFIVPIFCGAAIGMIVVDRYIRGRKKAMLIGSLWGAGVVMILLATFTILHITAYSLVIVILLCLGFIASIVMITSQTVIQEETPKELMGRVMGTFKLLQSMVIIVPGLIVGIAIDLIGVVPVLYILSGAIFVVAMICTNFKNKNFRESRDFQGINNVYTNNRA